MIKTCTSCRTGLPPNHRGPCPTCGAIDTEQIPDPSSWQPRYPAVLSRVERRHEFYKKHRWALPINIVVAAAFALLGLVLSLLT